MAYLHDDVLDLGLAELDVDATRLDICTTAPTTYTQATVTYTKGNKTSLNVGSPTARAPSGRKIVVPAITDGSVTGDGSVGFWALSDPLTSRLMAAAALSAPQTVTTGNTFTLTSFEIGIPGPA